MPKQPKNAERPFPWKCRHCGERHVVMSRIDYEAEVRHDGRLHRFLVPGLEIPMCESCGEKVFTHHVDRQINNQLRNHLRLLTPSQIRDALARVRMPQKVAAERLGIAEATLSRWLNETQIQSRAMDNLLRVFFALPAVRSVLSGEAQDPALGTIDVVKERGEGTGTGTLTVANWTD